MGTYVVVNISVVSDPVTVVTIVSMSVDTEVTVRTDVAVAVAVEVTTMVLVPLPEAELFPFLTEVGAPEVVREVAVAE